MLRFNELRVTPDNKYLIIEASIDPDPRFKDARIMKIEIDTEDTFRTTGPSTRAKTFEYRNLPRKVREIVDLEQFFGENKMFFVYLTSTGDISNAPCGLADRVFLGVTYNKYILHKTHIANIRNMDVCTPDKEFIDYVLRFNAFNMALAVGDHTKAIEYWKEFFGKVDVKSYKRCGCHGI